MSGRCIELCALGLMTFLLVAYLSIGVWNAYFSSQITSCRYRIDILVSLLYVIINSICIAFYTFYFFQPYFTKMFMHLPPLSPDLVRIVVLTVLNSVLFISLQPVPMLVLVFRFEDTCHPSIPYNIKAFYWISIIINLVILTPVGVILSLFGLCSGLQEHFNIENRQQIKNRRIRNIGAADIKLEVEQEEFLQGHQLRQQMEPINPHVNPVQTAYILYYFNWKLTRRETDLLNNGWTTCTICSEGFITGERIFCEPTDREVYHLECVVKRAQVGGTASPRAVSRIFEMIQTSNRLLNHKTEDEIEHARDTLTKRMFNVLPE